MILWNRAVVLGAKCCPPADSKPIDLTGNPVYALLAGTSNSCVAPHFSSDCMT